MSIFLHFVSCLVANMIYTFSGYFGLGIEFTDHFVDDDGPFQNFNICIIEHGEREEKKNGKLRAGGNT